MIDPHVHLRDWKQAYKETLRHGLTVAWRAGLDGVFEMPNTDPPLASRSAILRRIDDADRAMKAAGISLFHGLYAGLTAEPRQIEEMVRARRELFPRVVGLKMFAGHSTGNMGIVSREAQALVYATLAKLGYDGVLAVHCEKEALLHPSEWDPARPASHLRARPPAAEVASVDDQLCLAREAGFAGTLHVCHISTPWALDLLRGKHAGRPQAAASTADAAPPVSASSAAAGRSPSPPLRVTCGLTPHHALLDAGMLEEPDGILLKMNPPLRPKPMPQLMLAGLAQGEIDWVETDHAPHAPDEKRGPAAASGIPVLPFYPRFVRLLSQNGFPRERIDEITHDAICRVFGVDIRRSGRTPEFSLAREYPFDPFSMSLL